jgi:uncharacterized protein
MDTSSKIHKYNREFQVFIKPVGAICNLSCSYCYYVDKKDIHPQKSLKTISPEILETCIIQLIESTHAPYVLFSWHGGEPTLAGLDFYKHVVDLQKKHNHLNKKIINGIQTNGTLLDDEWCRFFAKEGFMVGLSMDGPENMHNTYRVSKIGKGSFYNVLDAYWLLKKYQITTEILCVVNALNVQDPLEVYRFFKSLGAGYISFLPLVERDAECSNGVSGLTVPPGAFGDFLVQVFDEWVENDIGRVKIQLFEEALRAAFNQDHTLCIFKKTCGGVPVLERDGNFYSCDHYVYEAYRIGNIAGSHLTDMLESPRQIQFGDNKYESLPGFCLHCEVLHMCHGECPKNRFVQTPDGQDGLNYLCTGYKKFFRHIQPFIEAIAKIWKH